MGTGMNMQASVHNLTQTERLQQETHRLPIAHQVQNEQQQLKDARHRLNVAPQADTVEGKITDSKDRKKGYPKKNGKRKKSSEKKKSPDRANEGFFIDCDA